MPALVLDLLWQHTASWAKWKQSAVSGIVFLAAFAAVQWPFADFLMLPAARNWFFGTQYFGYYAAPSSLYVRNLFFAGETGPELWRELALTVATAILSTRLGLAAGDWMRRIQR